MNNYANKTVDMIFLKFICVLVFELFSLASIAQLEKFIYPISESNDSLKSCRLLDFIPNDTGKNIFLLSEIDHRFKLLEKERTKLLEELVKRQQVEVIFYENTQEHDTLLRKYLSGKLRIEEYKETMKSQYYLPLKILIADSINYPYYQDILREFDDLKKDNYLPFLRNAAEAKFINKLQAIDIGTQTMWLGLFHLIEITRSLNTKNNPVITRFLDSVRVKCRAEYTRTSITTDNEQQFEQNIANIEKFLTSLKETTKNYYLLNCWQNIFAVYIQANEFRDLSIPVTFGGKPLTQKEFVRKNSFRDSIMYDNFKFYLPDNWKNLILLFSTAHLIDSRNTENFKDVLEPGTKTLGNYLHENHEAFLRRIAFVCFNSIRNDPYYDNKYQKESLEYKLSKKYEMAYVDLKAYKDSPAAKKPFYMRPTFRTYRKLHWENIFDGIVFVKNCYCTNGN